jgi:hypothetical protein
LIDILKLKQEKASDDKMIAKKYYYEGLFEKIRGGNNQIALNLF